MIEHVWSILCSNTITDKDTNNISIFNVTEQIKINAEPKPGGRLPIHLELVTFWTRDEANHPIVGRARITFVAPSGKVITTNEPKIDLEKAERMRFRSIFEGLMLEESGRHYFSVERLVDDEWQHVATVPLIIEFSSPELSENKIEETL